MYLVFGNGKWCKNHQRILTELDVKFVLLDLPDGSDFKDVITKDIEGVFIVCSTVNHFPILLHCFGIGVPVFCEKPICLNKRQLDALKFQFNKSEKQIFMSGHQLVFLDTFKNINNARHFNSMRAGAIPRTEGAILSLAVHDIAVAQHILKSEEFEVLNVEGNMHECKIYLRSLPNDTVCEIYVSSYSKIRLRNITVVSEDTTIIVSPDNWGRTDLLKLELTHFIECVEKKIIPKFNTFQKTYIIMDTIFKIMNELEK